MSPPSPRELDHGPGRLLVLGLLAFMTIASCSRTEKVQAFPDHFVGVGLELTIKEGYPVVVRTLPGGSAHGAGVEPGDRVLMIDEHATHGMTLGNAVMLIRGEPGSQVKLTIERRDTRILVVVPRKAMVKSEDTNYRAAQQ